MSRWAQLEDCLAALGRAGFARAELFAKRGRTRRLAESGGRWQSAVALEEGWAVRAGDRRRSGFAAFTGVPDPDRLASFAAEAPPLALPAPRPLPPWEAPADLEAPLATDGEAEALIEGLHRALAAEDPEARLTAAAVEDGASESQLLAASGLRVGVRHRLAALHLAAATRRGRGARVELVACEREARRFRPRALARRLGDRLQVLAEGRPPENAGGELVLAPPLASHLLAAVAPLFCGAEAVARLRPLSDRAGRLAAGCITLIDDGRFPGGLFAAPVDGEGQPTAALELIAEGRFVQPLLAWWEAEAPARAIGCVRRVSFRDLPQRRPSHLYLRPQPQLSPAELVAGVDRGHYLLDAVGGVRLDARADRFAVEVCGFALAGGRAQAPIAGARLVGSLQQLLSGAVAVARDLEWTVADAAYGAPTLLVSGLALERSDR